jgi:uncharacterized alkaline shock family protein YloU
MKLSSLKTESFIKNTDDISDCDLLVAQCGINSASAELAALSNDFDIVDSMYSYIEKFGIDDRMEKLFGKSFHTLGLSISNPEMGCESIKDTLVAFGKKIMEMIRKVYAWIIDFIKKYIGTQKRLIKTFDKIAKKYEGSDAEKEFDNIKDKKINTYILDALRVCEKIHEAGAGRFEELIKSSKQKQDKSKALVELVKRWWRYDVGEFTAITITDGPDSFELKTKPAERSISELWKNADAVNKGAKLMKEFSENWAKSKVYGEFEKSISETTETINEIIKDREEKASGELSEDDKLFITLARSHTAIMRRDFSAYIQLINSTQECVLDCK